MSGGHRLLTDRALLPAGRPRWTGDADLSGRTLLVRAEQGLGDTLQYCRYLPRLQACGAPPVLSAPEMLLAQFGSLRPQITLVGTAATEPSPGGRHNARVHSRAP